MYASNRGALQYIRQILTAIKEEMNSNTIIVTKAGNFNTSLSSMGRSSREKINKEMLALNDTLDQTDLMDVYRAIHTKAAGYTFFLSAQEHSPGLTTCKPFTTKQASVNLRKLKSYQPSFPITKL